MPIELQRRLRREGILLSKQVKISELYVCNEDYLKPLFNSLTYPWEILPKIGEYINKLISDGIEGYTLLKEGVYVGKNVKIYETATIEPPCIIGDNVTIRPGAFIRGNVIIGKNSVIGNSTELKNCVLLEKVEVPHYNYVGDSVLGNFSHLGAGSVCSNLKADNKSVVVHGDVDYSTNLRKVGAFLGDKANVGCNCVLNPGTVIGKNTSVYPLSCLRGVYESESIVKSKDCVVKRV